MIGCVQGSVKSEDSVFFCLKWSTISLPSPYTKKIFLYHQFLPLLVSLDPKLCLARSPFATNTCQPVWAWHIECLRWDLLPSRILEPFNGTDAVTKEDLLWNICRMLVMWNRRLSFLNALACLVLIDIDMSCGDPFPPTLVPWNKCFVMLTTSLC